MANGPLDFSSSPTLVETVEELIHTAGEGHQNATYILLEMGDPEKIVGVLLAAGLHNRFRAQAQLDAMGND